MGSCELRRDPAFQTKKITQKIPQLTLLANHKERTMLACAVTTFGWIRGITGEAVSRKSFQSEWNVLERVSEWLTVTV